LFQPYPRRNHIQKNRDNWITRPSHFWYPLGAVRNFDIRKKQNHSEKYTIRLEHGSLLIMKGDLQSKWEHRIAKTTQKTGPIINLTFRKIIGQ